MKAFHVDVVGLQHVPKSGECFDDVRVQFGTAHDIDDEIRGQVDEEDNVRVLSSSEDVLDAIACRVPL